jgi:hypothetical protein
MKLALHNLLGLLTRSHQNDEDREDIELIEMAKNDTFRPLREVLDEIEAKKRGELHRPVKQSCG